MSLDVSNPYKSRGKTFADQCRELPVGEYIEIGKDPGERQSRFVNAKAACPDSRFSMRKQPDGSFRLYKVL
jgi:hypothetical protein